MGESCRELTPIYVRQGLRWEAVELYWLRRFLAALKNPRIQSLKIFSLPMKDVYGRHWSMGHQAVPGARTRDEAVFLPGRNLLLTVKAAVFCALQRIPVLALAPLGGNPFPDATPAFFKAWQKTLSDALAWNIQMSTPFRALEKQAVIRAGRRFPLWLSFSCLAPRGRLHCGRCNKCAERRQAFQKAGVEDKTVYAKK